MQLRTALVPVVNFGSTMGYLALLGGFLLQLPNLVWIGVFLFSFGAIFALMTLPVEYDASNRALAALQATGVATPIEYDGAREVLSAAAWTYVAGFLQAVSQLLYFVFHAIGMTRGDYWSHSSQSGRSSIDTARTKPSRVFFFGSSSTTAPARTWHRHRTTRLPAKLLTSA